MQPARLILAVRTIAKGEEAAKKIQAATGFTSCEVWQLDMLREESVKAFADRVDRELDRLDIAVSLGASQTCWHAHARAGAYTFARPQILNAGIVMAEYELAPSGNTTQ